MPGCCGESRSTGDLRPDLAPSPLTAVAIPPHGRRRADRLRHVIAAESSPLRDGTCDRSPFGSR